MATIVAVRSGNWSDTSHVTGPWPGASTPTTKPGVGDTVQAGEFVVEIDEDVHVAMLEATGSGYFAVSNVYPAPQRPNITAAIVNNETANGTLRINNGGTIGNIIGNLTAGDVNGAWAVYNSGTIGDINGDMTAGDANGAWAVYNNGGTIGDITGDITAGDAGGACAVYNGGTIGDIDGSLICGATGQFPIFGPFRLVANPANSITVRQPNGDHWTLSNDYPAEADVKSGVDYNRGTQTGELATGGSIGPVSIVIGGGGIRIF